jgi:2,3-bisphosphoglycerate-independent phosphoglycerate mutase
MTSGAGTRKRLLLIIFDGLGDRPAPELGGKTPLEAAHTPNIDRLAREGINGLVHAKSPGYALGSPIALHLLFGYPEEQFPDRGPLLARARGLAIAEDDIVLAARLSSGRPEGNRLRLVERFIDGREEACEALAESIAEYECDGLTFRYTYCGGGDGMLFISGKASFGVTDTDPLALDLPVLRPQVRDDHAGEPSAARTAAALERYLSWAHARLRAHPASTADRGANPINVLITKWAGPKPSLEPFVEKWGMRGASLPDEEVVSGIMMEMGFHMVEIRGQEPEIDLRTRLRETRRLLDEGYEFIHLHTKYPDPMSHANEPERCREAIEALDRAMAAYWEELADDPNLVTVLTTDHTTPSVWGHVARGTFYDQHGGEPGPIAIRGGNVRVDGVSEYGERAVALGGLGQLRGEDFMPVLLNAAERTNMYEMRPTPVRRLYMPDEDGLDALEFAPDA